MYNCFVFSYYVCLYVCRVYEYLCLRALKEIDSRVKGCERNDCSTWYALQQVSITGFFSCVTVVSMFVFLREFVLDESFCVPMSVQVFCVCTRGGVSSVYDRESMYVRACASDVARVDVYVGFCLCIFSLLLNPFSFHQILQGIFSFCLCFPRANPLVSASYHYLLLS